MVFSSFIADWAGLISTHTGFGKKERTVPSLLLLLLGVYAVEGKRWNS